MPLGDLAYSKAAKEALGRRNIRTLLSAGGGRRWKKTGDAPVDRYFEDFLAGRTDIRPPGSLPPEVRRILEEG